MAKDMRSNRFVYFGKTGCCLDSPLEVGFVQVVALHDAAGGIDGKNGRGEYVLPGKLAIGVDIFSFEGVR